MRQLAISSERHDAIVNCLTRPPEATTAPRSEYDEKRLITLSCTGRERLCSSNSALVILLLMLSVLFSSPVLVPVIVKVLTAFLFAFCHGCLLSHVTLLSFLESGPIRLLKISSNFTTSSNIDRLQNSLTRAYVRMVKKNKKH